MAGRCGFGKSPCLLASTSVLNFLGSEHVDLLPFNKRVGRVLNYTIVGGEARDDLYGAAIVLPHGDGNEMSDAILYRADTQSVAVKDQRGTRNNECRTHRIDLEVNLGQGSGEQFAVTVVDIDLYEQGAAGGIDGIGGPNEFAVKDLAGMFGEGEVDEDALHA